MIKTYDYEVQKLYLELMLADAEVFVRCQGIFDHSLFDRKLQDAAEFMHEYAKGYNVLPDYEMVKPLVELNLHDPMISKMVTWIGSWMNLKSSYNTRL